MKLFEKHKKRVEKVKDFTAKNKVFAIMMVVAVIFMLVNFVFTSDNNPQETNHTASINENTDVTDEPAAVTETQREIWRFYFIDLVILGAGGGFCLIMILRQRKKTKEELK
jgi:cell division protein FtsL